MALNSFIFSALSSTTRMVLGGSTGSDPGAFTLSISNPRVRALAICINERISEGLKTLISAVVSHHRGERHAEPRSSLQEGQLDNAGGGGDRTALLLNQPNGGLHRAAGGDQIVKNDDPLPA